MQACFWENVKFMGNTMLGNYKANPSEKPWGTLFLIYYGANVLFVLPNAQNIRHMTRRLYVHSDSQKNDKRKTFKVRTVVTRWQRWNIIHETRGKYVNCLHTLLIRCSQIVQFLGLIQFPTNLSVFWRVAVLSEMLYFF